MDNLEAIADSSKIRIPETNVLMREAYAPYILSGNTSSIPTNGNNAHEVERLKEIEEEEKVPHDIAIPMYVFYELNQIKDSTNKTQKEKNQAREAQRVLEELIRSKTDVSYEDFKSQGAKFFDEGIELSNGAKVFFPDITREDFSKRYTSVIPAKADDYIMHTAAVFKEKHPEYAKHVIISNDRDVRNRSRLLGMEADDFRYGKVRNPLQHNKGVAYKQINYGTYQRIKNADTIDLEDTTIPLELNPKFLITNQVVGFKKRKKEYTDEDDKFDVHYMRVDENKHLVQLKYFNEFLEFFNGFKSKDEIKKDADEARKAASETQNEKTIDDIIAVEKADDERFTYDFLKERVDYAVRRQFLTKSVRNKSRKALENFKNDTVDKQFPVYQKLHSTITSLIENKERKLSKQRVDREKKKQANMQMRADFSFKYSFNKDLQPEAEQMIYIDHLLNPDIYVTTIDATGGFGKTLWAAAVGLYMLDQGSVDQIVYIATETRTKLGRDPGAMPGDLRQKIDKKTKPFSDNLEVLFNYKTSKKLVEAQGYLKELENNGNVIFDIPQSMTGVSKQKYFFIIDDAHFYSKDEMVNFLGRGGKGTYFAVAGGMEQLPYISEEINKNNNGIIHCAAELYGNPMYAHLSATGGKTHRGPGAELAAILGGRVTK